jgi:hypothetical protein
MPFSTCKYDFEVKVLKYTHGVCRALIGKLVPFIMIFHKDGSIQRIHFDNVTELLDKVRGKETGYLLFDPFDEPEYSYVEWNHINRLQMETLLEVAFEPGDFVARKHDEVYLQVSFPESWKVMF